MRETLNPDIKMVAMIIGAITLESENIKQLCSFYQSVLEIPEDQIVVIRDEHYGFGLDNTYLGFDKKSDVKEGGNTILWFRTDNVQDLFDKFVTNGAKVNYEPNSEMSPGEILAEVYDIDGNKVGIIGPSSD